jgi:hypothetical protein
MKTPDLQETKREENYIASFISSGNGRWLEVEDIKDLSSSGDGGYGEILYLSFPAMAFGSWSHSMTTLPVFWTLKVVTRNPSSS